MDKKLTFSLFKKYWNDPGRDPEIEDYLLTSNELFLNYIRSQNKLPEFLRDLNNK